MLGGGEVGGGGGLQEVAGDRMVDADAAGVEHGGEYGFAVAVGGLFPVLDEGWPSGEDLGEAGINGVQGDADALVGAGERFAAALFGWAECVAYPDGVGEAKQVAVVCVRVGLPGRAG